MERTESFVIEVLPAWENIEIQHRQNFGWSLQNRQELFNHSYYDRSTNTQYISNIVKLHFARSVQTPNLSIIKQLETEYFNLSFPTKLENPISPIHPILTAIIYGFIGLCIAGVLAIYLSSRNIQASVILPIVFSCIGMIIGFYVGQHQQYKKAKIDEENEKRKILFEQLKERQSTILKQVKFLL